MTDERLDKLATYFIHFDIKQRFGIPFIKFINMVESGRWKDIMVCETKYFEYQCKLKDVF